MRTFVISIAMTFCLLFTFVIGVSAHTVASLQESPKGIAGCKPSFPNDAEMTWNNIAYQAWIRPVEGPDRHFNFAIQNCGPSGPGSYVANFHITLLSLNKGQWQTSDSKQGKKTWGNPNERLCASWYDAGYGITDYVSGFVGSGYSSLYSAALDQVLGSMNVQLYNACGN